MEHKVKRFGPTGLHVLLSKKLFKEGDLVEVHPAGFKGRVFSEEEEKRVREIAAELVLRSASRSVETTPAVPGRVPRDEPEEDEIDKRGF